MKLYDHLKIEKKWQKEWQKEKTYLTADKKKEKAYVLAEFPYPSGEGLHAGHTRIYTAADVYARKKRMEGFGVLHPMGWDAFGLPAEQFAIKHKVHPSVSVARNTARFKEQMDGLGLSYDWDREINTTDAKFYKWTQWIFLKLFERGLAFQSYEPINWCPTCETGLANEDLEDGKCERCGTLVEKRSMRQWVLRITDYADRLINDLDTLSWPEHMKELQRNWIGRSEGAELSFQLLASSFQVKVFTTRVDTIFGATYLVLAPEHPLLSKEDLKIENKKEVEAYVKNSLAKEEVERSAEGKDKTGVRLEGVMAINPATQEEIPVFVADYVLGSYGTGAIMAVPAHDERDNAFAKKYKLPIKEAVLPFDKRVNGIGVILETSKGKFLLQERDEFAPRAPGVITHFGGMIEKDEEPLACAIRELKEELELEAEPGDIQTVGIFESVYHPGNAMLMFHIKGVDPKKLILHEGKSIVETTVEKALENEKVTDFTKIALRAAIKGAPVFTGNGRIFNSGKFDGMDSEKAKDAILKEVGGEKTVQYRLKDWVFSRQRYWGEPIPIVHCENCGAVPVSESDLPVRLPDVEFYEPSGTGESPLANISEWVNTKCPKCGAPGKRETNTMPQWAGSSWYYLRYIDAKNDHTLVDEKKEKEWMPVDVYVGGAEHVTRHLIYARFWHKFLFDIGVVSTEEPFKRREGVGLVLGSGGVKMSKRLGNVINPTDIVESYGADTLRLYEMFMGPFEQSVAWSEESIIGPRRFLEKVWKLSEKKSENENSNEKLETLLHQTIKKVTEDIEAFKFNTAVSALMILVNEMEKEKEIGKEDLEIFLKLLAPFAPHMSEELWREGGNTGSIHLSPWPTHDEKKVVSATVTIAVQVNGKVRANLIVPSGSTEGDVTALALDDENVKKWMNGQKPSRIVYVQGKLISIVLSP